MNLSNFNKLKTMMKRCFNLFLIASYLFATGTAALHTHDHGHGQHHEQAGASEQDSHAGCTHHHQQQPDGSQHEPHEHAPAYEHECGMCAFAGLQIDIATAPHAQSAGTVVDGFVWSEPINPTLAAVYGWNQRGPPTA